MIKYTEKYVINRDTESPSQKPRSERPASAENSAQRGLSIEKHTGRPQESTTSWETDNPECWGPRRQVPPRTGGRKRQLLSKTRGRHPAPRARDESRHGRAGSSLLAAVRQGPRPNRTGQVGTKAPRPHGGVRAGGVRAGRGVGLGAGATLQGSATGRRAVRCSAPSSAFPRSTRAAVASGPVAVAVLHCGCCGTGNQGPNPNREHSCLMRGLNGSLHSVWWGC